VDEQKPAGKPFSISKQEVWDAWLKVKANKGAPGVDEQSIEDFEADLKGNLYKIWNRMSSGSYFPPPVKAVEIPKPHGGGTRVPGVPCVADRIAQTVVAARLEKAVEPVFHPDSYGYRPGRSALDAVAVPALAARPGVRLVVVDEIGKMESLSPRFAAAVRAALDSPVPVLGTIARSGGALIAEVRRRPDVTLVDVTPENRDALPAKIAGMLGL